MRQVRDVDGWGEPSTTCLTRNSHSSMAKAADKERAKRAAKALQWTLLALLGWNVRRGNV
jgi:hypothetical protein